ncbi:translation initiation factor IF-2-like [Peromyscus leucopus]|uniref:translation initiation factor IF-2-like n=1 Tax=Peromyscus leucopus TaxID=10041 RepID=UPI001884AC2D|nr:translation initiation factor IF-2-like [Peromyscus leucopus]
MQLRASLESPREPKADGRCPPGRSCRSLLPSCRRAAEPTPGTATASRGRPEGARPRPAPGPAASRDVTRELPRRHAPWPRRRRRRSRLEVRPGPRVGAAAPSCPRGPRPGQLRQRPWSRWRT